MKNLLKFNLGEKTIKKTVQSLGILSLFGGVGYCCYNTKFRNNYFNLLIESFCYLRYLKEFFNNKKILCQENYEDLYSDQTNNNSFYLNLGDNLYSTSTFYIVIDENNSSHADLVSKFLDTISKYNNSNISTNQINLKIISKPLNDNNNTESTVDKLLLLKNNYNCLLINSSLNKVKNSNDPAIFVCNDNSFITSINPYSIINSSISGSDLLANLTNMFNVKDYNSLRFHFRFLEEDPQRSIYIVKKSTIEDKYFKKHLSILHSMNSKVIVVNHSEIENQLELKDKIIYEYKSPKLPNKLKGVVLEKYLEITNERNNNNIHYNNSGENDTPEKNINDYLNNNPTSFLLKFNLFRNELIKIPEKNLTFNSIENNAKLIEILNRSYLKKAKHNEDNSNEQSINKDSVYINPELSRKRIINSYFYNKRNIVELAETDKNKIEKLLEEKNKHYLYIHLPSYSFIKEKIIDFVLYESNHLFDRILISTDKNFSENIELFDNSPLSNTLPQFFIKNTHSKVNGGGTYNLNFFKFPEEFDKFLLSQKEKFDFVEDYDNLTFVEKLNGTNFVEKLIADESFQECLLEIKHEGCPTCFMLGRMVDHLSQKFKKHDKMNQFRFFRIDTDNDIPLFGRFAATPTHLYLRKSEDKKKIDLVVPLEKNQFLFGLKKYSKLNLDSIKYHPNLMFGFFIYQKKEFSEVNYDPDLDVRAFQL